MRGRFDGGRIVLFATLAAIVHGTSHAAGVLGDLFVIARSARIRLRHPRMESV
jgi:hypothetical protein